MVYHSFGSMGPMLFNAVPKLVKSSISPESFKASLDDFLMTLPDTPPTPGYVAANNNSLLDSTATNGRALPELRTILESIQSIQSIILITFIAMNASIVTPILPSHFKLQCKFPCSTVTLKKKLTVTCYMVECTRCRLWLHLDCTELTPQQSKRLRLFFSTCCIYKQVYQPPTCLQRNL